MRIVILLILFSAFTNLFAADVEEVYDEEKEVEENYSGVERIFRNPALTVGIDFGAANLNKSIDSLMQGLFYNLMDNELVYDVTDNSQFSLKLNRDVYETSDGFYVVADRIGLGPQHSLPISSLFGLPIFLGGSGQANVLNIYLRSDGSRFVESSELPWWRSLVNNWFGLLPLLTSILPPSFNPNEMYDPLKELEAPFIFPTSVNAAYDMPIGNLRSYSVSAVIHTGLNFLGRKETYFEKELGQSFDVKLPFKIFKEGEHRINVLRRDGSRFWVGLSSRDRFGVQLNGGISKLFYVFGRVASYWNGLPAVVLPVDLESSKAEVFGYDMIFEFDLEKDQARDAFEKAVRGDFSASEKSFFEDGPDSGVRFEFTRKTIGDEDRQRTAQNLFVVKKGRDYFSSFAKVTTEDPSGRFFVLESKIQVEDSFWDVLVGAERRTFEARVTANVLSNSGVFVFDRGDPNPLSLTIGLNISDRYVDTLELRKYLALIRYFTRLPLKSIGSFPIRSQNALGEYRRKLFFYDPLAVIRTLGVTPIHLGKLDIDAALFFSFDDLKRASSKSLDKVASAFAFAFGLGDGKERIFRQDSLQNVVGEFAGYLTTPLELLNLRVPIFDVVNEYQKAVFSLNSFRSAATPQEMVTSLSKLMDTQYPKEMAMVLMLLAEDDIPRIVSFKSSPKGKQDAELKDRFKKIFNKTFRGKEPYPEKSRYSKIRSALALFNPRAMKEHRKRPDIRYLKLYGSLNSDPEVSEDLILRIDMPNSNRTDLKILVRLEQAGKVDIGRFVLFEDLTKAFKTQQILRSGSAYNASYVRLFGSGGLSENFIVNQALLAGGEFIVSISVSYDGQLWSLDRQLKFMLKDKKLYKSVM